MTFGQIRQRLTLELFDFGRESTQGERLFARLYEGLIAIWVLWHCFTWAAYIPRIDTVVLPLGIANYLDVSMFYNAPAAYGIAGVVTVLVGLGYTRRWKWAYAGAMLGFHVLYATRYSLGEISHGSNFVGTALLAFALATVLFDESEHALWRFALGFSLFFYGLGYTTAGFCKLIGTGIDWPAAQHFALWVGERTIDVTSRDGVFVPTILQRVGLEYPWFGSLSLTFGLLAEFAGVLIWFRRFRTPVLLALMGMHIGIDLTLDIMFLYNIMILALLAIPFPALFDRFVFNRAAADGR